MLPPASFAGKNQTESIVYFTFAGQILCNINNRKTISVTSIIATWRFFNNGFITCINYIILCLNEYICGKNHYSLWRSFLFLSAKHIFICKKKFLISITKQTRDLARSLRLDFGNIQREVSSRLSSVDITNVNVVLRFDLWRKIGAKIKRTVSLMTMNMWTTSPTSGPIKAASSLRTWVYLFESTISYLPLRTNL